MAFKDTPQHLRKKLPDILLESFFIVVALLGALAIDQWRDQQKDQKGAAQAEMAIREELQKNKVALEDKLAAHRQLLENIQLALQRLEKNPQEEPNFNFDYPMVLLSTASWDSARMTQYLQYLPIQRVSGYAQLYRFQELYMTNQDRLIEKIMEVGELDDKKISQFARGFKHRLQILIEMNQNFTQAFQDALPQDKP